MTKGKLIRSRKAVKYLSLGSKREETINIVNAVMYITIIKIS
jgi:rRNA processing protein Krr1/Pno1